MIDFTASIDEIKQDFTSCGIPIDSPGFYNHEAFLRIEQEHPEYLNNYARYVTLRDYDDAYLKRARTEIPILAEALHRVLLEDGRQGACVDTSGVFSKCLEKEGFWNYVVKGSLTTDYPPASGIGRKYFWTVDEGEFIAAHAWVFAPPFMIVDITVRQQSNTPEEYACLPDMILTEDPKPDRATIEDVIAPGARTFLTMQGVPTTHYFHAVNPTLVRFFKVFHASKVVIDKTALKYVPTAVGAPDCPLEEMIGLSQKSRNGQEIYEQIILPALEKHRG